MRAHAVAAEDVGAGQLGWVLAHDIRDSQGTTLLPKGTLLDAATLESWASMTDDDALVHLIEPEAGELHEDAAGLRVARCVAGAGVRVGQGMQSRYDLLAEHRGLLRVDAALLRAINAVGDVTLYSMVDRQPVTEGMVLASVKISPLVTSEERVAAVEGLCRAAAGSLLTVLPFQPLRVGVLVVEEQDAAQREQLRATLERKLGWFGASLSEVRSCAPQPEQVAQALRALLEGGADVLLAAGGNPIDPLDAVEQALALVDGRMLHRGAPMRGSMSWLAQIGSVPLVNLSSSRMWVGMTVGDIYLPMLMTGQPLTPADVLEIGYGGLPGSAIGLRFPPYAADSEAAT
jgi:hypothetical protein